MKASVIPVLSVAGSTDNISVYDRRSPEDEDIARRTVPSNEPTNPDPESEPNETGNAQSIHSTDVVHGREPISFPSVPRRDQEPPPTNPTQPPNLQPSPRNHPENGNNDQGTCILKCLNQLIDVYFIFWTMPNVVFPILPALGKMLKFILSSSIPRDRPVQQQSDQQQVDAAFRRHSRK